MKRIDDKIKEIEKKDKTSRILYILFVVIIGGFMWYALKSEKTIKSQGETIDEQVATISKQLENEKALTQQLKDTINLLKMSQTPLGYWNETKKDATAKSYMDYITHKGKPEVEYSEDALIELKSVNGKEGWLFCGRVDGNQFTESILNIVWRKGDDTDYQNAIPTEDDIVILNGRSRRLYSNTSQSNLVADWGEKVKGFVIDKKLEGNALFLKIKL